MWFSLNYKRRKFIIITNTQRVTFKRADGTETTEGWHCLILSNYREKLADSRMYCDFTKRAWHRYLKKNDDYAESFLLDKYNIVTSCRSISMAFEGAKGSMAPSGDHHFDTLRETANDGDY